MEAGRTLRDTGATDCAVAVVIPAHRQPGLLPEALESVLGQRAGFGIAAVVVDDGCPFPETAATARAYARAHPGRVHLLRRANGGLAAARNSGIGFALAAFPALRAIHFLDADNRLHPEFLARALALLEGSPPGIGWVYPDIDMFGLAANWSVRGAYSRLHHLVENTCEAGSLVRRAVFDAGLRFDEAMREGFEDWDFWLAAGARGFRGRHLPNAGFRYRRRAESLLAEAERRRDSLLAGLRAKRPALFRPRALLALEAEEAPRFAIWDDAAEGGAVRLTLDPAAPGDVAAAAAARARLVEAQRAPQAEHFPPVCCFAASGALAALGRHALLHGAFWLAGVMLRGQPMVGLQFDPGAPDEIGLESGEDVPAEAPVLFLRTAALAEFAGLPAAAPVIRARLPDGVPALPAAAPRLLAEAAALGAARRARSAIAVEWRADYRRPRAAAAAESARTLLGCGPLAPLAADTPARRIAFLHPAFEFGGAERVVLNYAAVLRGRGWRTHLVLAGAARARIPPEWRGVFDGLHVVPGAERADPAARMYLGAAVAPAGAEDDLVGLLAPMDAVLNTHAFAGHAAAGRLRRLGVATFCGLHMVGRAAGGNPMGHAHSALAYEHAYDGFVVVSRSLGDWCLGQGVPAAKISVVPNAPSYAADPARVAAALAGRRARRDGGEPLRMLHLGRLDAQKGIDRLAAVIAGTAAPAFAWRVVGRGAEAAPLERAGLVVEPPVHGARELDALYAWADVVVLPSRFEGLPLVALEAQRLGCVVVATDVGAVAEAVADRADGLLVPGRAGERAVVEGFVAALRELAADRALLARLGAAAAAARAADGGWDTAMVDWIARLDALTKADDA